MIRNGKATLPKNTMTFPDHMQKLDGGNFVPDLCEAVPSTLMDDDVDTLLGAARLERTVVRAKQHKGFREHGFFASVQDSGPGGYHQPGGRQLDQHPNTPWLQTGIGKNPAGSVANREKTEQRW